MGFVRARLQARHGAMRAAVLTALLFRRRHLTLRLGSAMGMGLAVSALTPARLGPSH